MACAMAPIAMYNYGVSALPLVVVLAFAAAAVSFIGASGLDSNPMPNMAISMLGITWIGVLGSFGGAIVGLSNVVVGSADGPLPNYGGIIGKNITLKGIAEGSRAMLARMVRAMEATGFAPVVDRVFAFDEALEACRYLKSAAHLGKVLIKVG